MLPISCLHHFEKEILFRAIRQFDTFVFRFCVKTVFRQPFLKKRLSKQNIAFLFCPKPHRKDITSTNPTRF